MLNIIHDSGRLKKVCAKYTVDSLSVFGSFARNENRADSDLDLLVSFSRPISLLKLVALERELSEFFGKEVDLLTEAALSPYLRDRILKEQQTIYAA
jgi:predicted nucleotidyltransferase